MDNNYKNIDEIIGKMRELRTKREMEILDSQLKNINLDSDYQENLNNHKVLNVKYLGDIDMPERADYSLSNTADSSKDLKKQKIAIFLLIEQQQDKDGNIVIVEKYYTEDFELLGGNNKSDEFDFIMLNREHVNEKELLDSLNGLDKEGKLDLEEIERRELEEIAKALGIDEKDIEKMSEMDLVKEIEEKQEDNKDNKPKEEKTDKQELNEEEVNKIINPQQEMKTKIKVDNKQTLGKVLGLDTGEFTKVAIVYSEKLQELASNNEKTNTTRYAFVAIRKDGTAQTINDKLEIDSASGNNPYKESIKIDADETAREDNKIRSRYKIKGRDEYLSIENGKYGELKAYYGKGKTRSENEAVETQLETTNVRPTSIELRKLQATYKGKYNTDKMAKEANQKFDMRKEKIGIKSVDGDENTIEHTHDDEETIYHVHVRDYSDEDFQELAKEMMKNDSIETEFTNEEVQKMIKNYWQKDMDSDKEYSVEEMKEKIENTEKMIEQDAENLSQQKKRI